MADRPTIVVQSPPGGWLPPWPNVAELEAVLPHQNWTLVGGLMTQLHCVHRGLNVIRSTSDVDIVLHVETTRGVAAAAAAALEALGYQLTPPTDPRNESAHRFRRGVSTIDLLTAPPGLADTVDVLVADHAPPRVIEKLRGRTMVAIEGGAQALRRTVNAQITIDATKITTVSMPRAFGALILKSAAYQVDSRDRDRHLLDAAALLCCIEDPYAEREQFAGSDSLRIDTLRRALPDSHPAWRALARTSRGDGQLALRILSTARPQPGSAARVGK